MAEAAPTIPESLLTAARAAHGVVVLTGAGVSAESGIPTFRDALTGLWAKYDPMQLATPQAFAADPRLVTRWYDQRRLAVLACQPNAGHRALARWQDRLEYRGGRFTLITQNVDRLHQRAGSRDVAELHGALTRWRCSECGQVGEETGPAFAQHPPRCAACGAARRPDVVWFGEQLPVAAFERARRAAESAALFLAVGTSGTVEPAAGLVRVAAAAGATTVEVNAAATALSDVVDHVLRGPAAVLLPRLVDCVTGC